MSIRFTGTLVLSFVCLTAPSVASAQVQTLTATHTYVLGDHDSKDDARQRCLLETKRKILEQAGVYIESASEVKDLQLTKDKITSFAAAVMQVKDTKEEFSFQQGQMTLTLTTTAQVDLDEVRKQLAARQLDAGVRDTVTAQQERLKRLEAQFEAIQKQQQRGQAPGRAPASSPSDTSTAELPMLQTQAAQGNVEAQIRLGWAYGFGEGVPQDYAQARMWWGRAAAQGDVVAQTALGALYADGLGGAQDYAIARQWFEKAAAQGNAMAQVGLGDMYYRGHGVPQDYGKARQWLEQAATKGDAKAQAFLGLLYAEGHGVPQDYGKARQWYEKAAAQGDADAQDNLGRLYFFGRGGPRDNAAAREWFAKSAAQGNVRSQVQLGALYEFGIGVPQNDMRAYMWYSLAAERSTDANGTYAADRRDNVFSRMTSAQVAEAQKRAREWKPNSK
jgi:TPR repeat protein